MSAFIVSTDHIDALLTGAKILCRPYAPFRWYLKGCEQTHDLASFVDPNDPDCDPISAVGRMLIAENVASVSYRYGEKDLAELPGPNDQTGLHGDYRFREFAGYPDPIVILKAVACYRYQSCETPDWEESEAFAFCDALEKTAISRLPGYDDAPGWSICDRSVFAARRVA
jgi:hypothetical protein